MDKEIIPIIESHKNIILNPALHYQEDKPIYRNEIKCILNILKKLRTHLEKT